MFDVHGGDVESLEHNLGHRSLLALGSGEPRSRERGAPRGDAKLVVEGVVPDLLHIIPVGDDTVLDGVLQSEDTTLGLGFITDVGITLFHTNHDTGLTGTADQRREDRAGSIISSETGCQQRGETI